MSANHAPFPNGVIGEISITGILGEGGMGKVYAGFDRRLERKVALKVIRRERSMDAVARQRFIREARMLSRIQHPNICRIHDLIERPEGDVLVLELVEGMNLRSAINDGIDGNVALEIGRQLLEVLVTVHRQGIVHRDLKPENIMVQPEGSIKVLDFGLARAIGETVPPPPGGAFPGLDSVEDDDATAEWIAERSENLTSQHLLVGTLRYMSPEQARGDQVGSASDIFSAGLIIREMLTGEAPFEAGLPIDVLLKRVAWGDLRPVRGLSTSVRTFLDRLTSVAPADRPSSRDALDQLQMILDAPRRKRRRVVLSGGLALMILLTVGMTVQWFRASSEADRARRSLAEAREVSVFLEQLFYLSDPFVANPGEDLAGAESITAGILLERGAETIRERFENQPLARARFMMVLGAIHSRLGRFDDALGLVEQAVEIRRERLSPDDPELGGALLELGSILRMQGKFAQAEAPLVEALEISSKYDAERMTYQPDILEEMALLAGEQGQFDLAKELFERVMDFRQNDTLGDRLALALTLQRFAALEISLGHRDLAHDRLSQALEIVREKKGVGSLTEVSVLSELARLETDSGKFKEAEKHWMSALATARSRLPGDHPLLATLLTNLANIQDEQGRYSEAEPLYREALEIKKQSVGENHPEYAKILFNIGNLVEHQGRGDEAELLYRQSLQAFESSLGADHPIVGVVLNSLANLKQANGEFLEAERLYGTALEIFKKAFGLDHAYCSMVLNNLGEVRRLSGRLTTAERYYRQALEVGLKVNGRDHPSTAEVLRGLAITTAEQGKCKEALGYFREALGILKTVGAPPDQVLSDLKASGCSGSGS